ncbi:GNAT family N-acetyltransferase [Muricauda sp. 334s03]|uniref:GNAT family N-acetyltransferase n=1 Tax=Flagellimonas yonaguniensis TaxID=3031325 RepID=A0ABT5XY71_9FLAO|nr:GNAT family N-acetyltransferase [[Muricauda] yonaguniensis]MDF0716133.1 GNAT family N-acetyltransferase [[Muricauda] yonaguniensis]
MIEYKREKNIDIEEFKKVLINSTLGERRPISEIERLSSMIEHSNLIITARENGDLIGISRSLTDFSFCTYLSDLAVDRKYQNKGIGKELIRRTKLEAPTTKLILLAAPEAVSYYPKIGMSQYEFCYYLNNAQDLL